MRALAVSRRYLGYAVEARNAVDVGLSITELPSRLRRPLAYFACRRKVLRKWVRETSLAHRHAFPEHGLTKPEQQKLDWLREEVASLKAECGLLKRPQPTLRRRTPLLPSTGVCWRRRLFVRRNYRA